MSASKLCAELRMVSRTQADDDSFVRVDPLLNFIARKMPSSWAFAGHVENPGGGPLLAPFMPCCPSRVLQHSTPRPLMVSCSADW